MPDGPYCREHARVYQEAQETQSVVAAQFAALLAQLDANPPDCAGAVVRELDMLASARRILVAHADLCSRSGWRGLSPINFMRLWLSSASAANDLLKSRWVMETASGADIDRLLANVYNRVESAQPPVQQALPLPGFEPDEPVAAASCASPPTPIPPEELLAIWLQEANGSLGSAALQRVAEAYARENPGSPAAAALGELARALPSVAAQRALTPSELADRLTLLADTMDRSPDLARVAQLLPGG
jgi:hypothetical protein